MDKQKRCKERGLRHKGSEKKVNVDYRTNSHATAAERIYYERLIPEEDWELLTGGKYGRCIEIDNVIAYVGAERFWNEFILPCFQQLFDTADYNLSRLYSSSFLFQPIQPIR
jgi:hypothetical protein